MSSLRVAILTGLDSASTRLCIEQILALPGVEVVGILEDSAVSSPAQRRRNLKRNLKREGWTYPFWRLARAVLQKLDQLAVWPASVSEVNSLLRQAFPAESFSLSELAAKHKLPLRVFENLNRPDAASYLSSLNADLGVVLGTRILKPTTFSVPRLGSINLHKGNVPDYRGMPPAFWELFDGREEAGVTVHFLDAGLDTGDVVLTGSVPIHALETPATLRRKLDVLGASVLAEAITRIASGSMERTPQRPALEAPGTNPTRKQTLEFSRRAPHLASTYRPVLYNIFKTCLYLALTRSGFLALLRSMRRSPHATILLYHRVDDFSQDILTISRRRFAEHLSVLQRFYEVRGSAWLVDRILNREPIPPSTVVIHFDDCYESVASAAGPLLASAKLPATHFISSGYIDSNRKFTHDLRKYPLDYANLTSQQVRELSSLGIGVAAHTINHCDMGSLTADEAVIEFRGCREHLESLVEGPVDLFSFPYGRPGNFKAEFTQIARNCGYRAIFSAYGGWVDAATDAFDIPRIGVSEDHRALDLLVEIEGWSMSRLKQLIRGR